MNLQNNHRSEFDTQIYFTISSLDNSAFSLITNSKKKYIGLSEGLHLSVSGSIESDIPVDLTGTQYIQIITDIPVYSTNTWNDNNNVLATIIPNRSYGSYIDHTFHNIMSLKKQIQQIQERNYFN